MSSREDILQLIYSYTFLLDQGDLQGFAALFEHAEWGAQGSKLLSGKEHILQMMEDIVVLYADGTPRTRHVMSNIDLQVDEAQGSATCQSYITLFQQTDDFPLQLIFSGQYADEFQRLDGRWWFRKRIIQRPFYGDMSAHLKQSPRFV